MSGQSHAIFRRQPVIFWVDKARALQQLRPVGPYKEVRPEEKSSSSSAGHSFTPSERILPSHGLLIGLDYLCLSKQWARDLTCHGADGISVAAHVQHALQPIHATCGTIRTPNGDQHRVETALAEANKNLRTSSNC